jgi:hypothetical protein
MKLTANIPKRTIIPMALLLTTVGAYAQNVDLKEKKMPLNENAKIVYHVKENNVKEGAYYIKNAKTDQLIVKGAYTDNKRSGNWYFYDESGKPETVYSYQQNKLAFIDSSLVNKLTINIPNQEKEVVEQTQIPVLLTSMRLFLAEMSNNIAIPKEHFPENGALPIQIVSEIDADGQIHYTLRYSYKNKLIEQPVRLKRSAFDIEWIPAVYNKKPIKAEVIVNTEINGSGDGDSNLPRFRWNDKQ